MMSDTEYGDKLAAERLSTAKEWVTRLPRLPESVVGGGFSFEYDDGAGCEIEIISIEREFDPTINGGGPCRYNVEGILCQAGPVVVAAVERPKLRQRMVAWLEGDGRYVLIGIAINVGCYLAGRWSR